MREAGKHIRTGLVVVGLAVLGLSQCVGEGAQTVTVQVSEPNESRSMDEAPEVGRAVNQDCRGHLGIGNDVLGIDTPPAVIVTMVSSSGKRARAAIDCDTGELRTLE
jgi:hypothetical protein